MGPTVLLLCSPASLLVPEGCAAPERDRRGDTTAAAPSTPPVATSQPAGDGPGAPGSPPLGRYTCLRLGISENQIAPDLTLLPGDRYSSLDETGTYSYDPASRTITWLSGSLATSRTNWVGVFVPGGQAGASIESAKDPTIAIRDREDVAAGNKRDLQWCNHAG